MEFDQKLNWKAHLKKKLRKKYTKAMSILKCLTHLNWGAGRITLLRLYHALIMSRIDYGCQFYAATAEPYANKINTI